MQVQVKVSDKREENCMDYEKKVLLIILDGWGITQKEEENLSAISQADTPFMDDGF